MYSACIHCQRDLGRNEAIEHLPIGRRIAFDEAAGRLWVICAGCARWNLVPFESRWEAIEAGEKLYRDSPKRMSTGQIGLAKTSDGTELVRIGAPLRPEMAAWRYGPSFLSRRWKYATTTLPATLILSVGWQFVALPTNDIGVRLAAALGIAGFAGLLQNRWITGRTQAVMPLGSTLSHVSRSMVRQVIVEPSANDTARIWIPAMTRDVKDLPFLAVPMAGVRSLIARLHGDYSQSAYLASGAPSHFTMVEGDEAQRALRVILPLLHEDGSTSKKVAEATAHLTARNTTMHQLLYGDPKSQDRLERTQLGNIYKPRRLALEMFVHEDSERRWLAGELLDLEEEWRRANEIAVIADALLRDPAVEQSLNALRDKAPGHTEA